MFKKNLLFGGLASALVAVIALGIACGFAQAAERSFYCSPSGADDPAGGTKEKPWKTINYALERIGSAGGATVQLADGSYGAPRQDWKFDAPVTLRAENQHKAHIERLRLYGARNITFEGINFDRKSAPSPRNVVHFDGQTSYCILRGCRLTHGAGGYQDTDALKINVGSHHILIEECIIFDGTDEEVDFLGNVHDIVLRRNIVYQSKVTKPEALISNKIRAYRMMYEGNIFANLNPESSNGALRFGGSERKGQEADTVIAVGNLFVNTTGRGAITFVGAKNCLVADNIFINHDDQRTGAVAIYTNYPAGGITNDEIYIVHNIFYEAGGRWTKPVYAFVAALPKTWLISHNLYWNGGKAIPKDAHHDPSKEEGALVKDPLFRGDLAKLTGTPTREWFEVLKLKKDSPFFTNALELEKLKLPAKLKEFLEDYRTGKRDPWYRSLKEGR